MGNHPCQPEFRQQVRTGTCHGANPVSAVVGFATDDVEIAVELDVDLGAIVEPYFDLVVAELVAEFGVGHATLRGVDKRRGGCPIERVARDPGLTVVGSPRCGGHSGAAGGDSGQRNGGDREPDVSSIGPASMRGQRWGLSVHIWAATSVTEGHEPVQRRFSAATKNVVQ